MNGEHKIGIKNVRRYPTFSEILEHEEAERIVPGVSKDQILRVLKSLYPPFKEKSGVFAIELESSKSNPQK